MKQVAKHTRIWENTEEKGEMEVLSLTVFSNKRTTLSTKCGEKPHLWLNENRRGSNFKPDIQEVQETQGREENN